MPQAKAFFPLFILFASALNAQEADSLLRVYTDCPFCDDSYIRTGIPYVHHMRDRKDALVHILVTEKSAGGGGEAYTVTFTGAREFSGLNDTLQCHARADATDSDTRNVIVQTIRLGLVRYLARTPLAGSVQVTVPSAVRPDTSDPWKHWIFTAGLSAYLSGQESSRYGSFSGNLFAGKVTKALKSEASVRSSYTENLFQTSSSSVLSLYRSHGADWLLAAGLGERWSAGGYLNLYSSLYENVNLSALAQPAAEFNLFGYGESTRRELRFLYRAGSVFNRYNDTTIFNKTEELLWNESLLITLTLKEPWGSVSASVKGSHYFHDLLLNRLTFFTSTSLRLFRGFSFNLYGNLSLIHDQVSLPKGDATDEDILLQQRQLATQYSYYTSLGFSYTFGSIYNNVVNTRFGE